MGLEMVFNDVFTLFPADSAESLRDFCPWPEGSKSEKISGEGAPLWGEFNGEVEIVTQISRPLIIRGRRFGEGSTRRFSPYLTP